MAKSENGEWMWLIALAIGGYLLYSRAPADAQDVATGTGATNTTQGAQDNSGGDLNNPEYNPTTGAQRINLAPPLEMRPPISSSAVPPPEIVYPDADQGVPPFYLGPPVKSRPEKGGYSTD